MQCYAVPSIQWHYIAVLSVNVFFTDLTPPKSPDHHETSVKELQNLSLSPASQNSVSPAKGNLLSLFYKQKIFSIMFVKFQFYLKVIVKSFSSTYLY